MLNEIQTKQLIDQLEFQINESITIDPIITSEEANFISNFIENPSVLVTRILGSCNELENTRLIIEAIMKKISALFTVSPLSEESARFASIYLNVIMKCLDQLPNIKYDDILSDSVLEEIISFAKPALLHANPSAIRMTYTQFAQKIGSYSEKVFQIFLPQIKSMVKKKPTSSDFKYNLMPFSRFIANKQSVSCALHVFSTLYEDFVPNYKLEIFEIISQFIMQCFRITPSDFMDDNINLKPAKTILKRLCIHRLPTESYKWEVFISLILLRHKSIFNKKYDTIFNLINKTLQKKIHGFENDKKYALTASLYTALAVAETDGIPSYVALYNKFKPALLDLAKRKMQDISKIYPQISYFMFADFPISLYYTDPEEFTQVMSVYNGENSGVPFGITARVIEHCSNCINSEEKRVIINISIARIINSASFDKQAIDALPNIFKAFEKDNKLLLDVVEFNPSFLLYIFGPYSKSALQSFSNAFLKTMEANNNLHLQFTCFEFMMSALNKKIDQYLLMKDDTLVVIAPILEYIVRTAKVCINDNKEEIGEARINSFVLQMEIIALCFLPTPLSSVSLKILQFVVDIASESSSDELSKIPVENYKELISVCNGLGKFDSSNNDVYKPLLSIPSENHIVTNTLWRHISALAHGLDPVTVDDAVVSVSNVQSPALMRAEFADSVRLYCALTRKLTNNFTNILMIVLKSGGYIGSTVAQVIPPILLPCNYANISKAVYNKMRDIGASLTDSNTCFTANSMKLFQNFLDSPNWTTDVISVPLAERIALCFTEYINMLVSAQRLAQCCEFLISFMMKYKSIASQECCMQIATIIASWLTRLGSGKSTIKAGASICTALALAVDKIPFAPDVYDDLVFIVSALNARLEKQEENHEEIAKAISSVFKSNFSLFSKSELARSLIGSEYSRAAYILAAKEAICNRTNDNKSNIIDYLFANDFEILIEIMKCIPVKQCEAFSIELSKAAISRHVDAQFIEKMTDLEVKAANEATKNKIFRGNAIMSRSIMAYTRIFGDEWVMTIYNPLIEYTREMLKRGEHVNIKAERLPPGEDIDDNRKTFRKYFIEAISIITAAIPKLPIQIIQMLQIVNKIVSRDYGELGIMILNGILFLRFIIPTLAAPSRKLTVTEDERQSLVTLSIVLMAASLRGDLTDKGEDYIMFNDIASLALDRFSASVNHIIEMDLTGAAAKWIEVNEAEVSDSLSEFLARNNVQFKAILDNIEKTRPLTENEKNVIECVDKFIPPPIIKKAMKDPEEVFASACKDMKEIVSTKEEYLQEEALNDFFFRDALNAGDFDVFYLFAAKQPADIDEKIILSHIFNTIATAPKDYYIIADFADYDISRFPTLFTIKKFLSMIPQCMKDSLRTLYVLRSTREFVKFYNANKHLLQSDRMVFVETGDDITTNIKLINTLPLDTLEAIQTTGSLQNTIIDGNDVVIRVTKFSLHTTSYIEKVPVNSTILIRDIQSVSELTAPDETLAFTINMKDGKEYHFTTSHKSGLYYLIVSAFERANREEIKYPQICTDSSDVNSSKWLLLLISLIGMSNEDCPYLKLTSYQLLKTVVKEYNFQITVPDTVEEASKGCYDIMKQAAESMPQDAGHFIVEADKVINLLEDPLPLFKLIPPWAEIIAKGYGGYTTLRYLIDLTSKEESCMKIVEEGIWPALMDPHYIKRSLEVFFPIASAEMSDMLIQFAITNEDVTILGAINELLARRQNAPANIQILFDNDCFDYGMFGPNLIHATCLMRKATTSNDALADLTVRAVKETVIDANTCNLKDSLLSSDDSVAAQAILTAISGNRELKESVLELFKEDLENNNNNYVFHAISSPEVFVQYLSQE